MDLKKVFGLNLAAGCLITSCFGLFFIILLGFAVDQLPFGLSNIGWAWMQGRLDAVDTYNVDIVIASSYYGEYCAPAGLPGGGSWRITQVFHDSSYNPNHAGIDFGIPVGTTIQSTIGGEVTYAGWNTQGYGNLVIVQNGSVATYYGHLSGISVYPGQVVTPGALLGLSGNSGNSTGPHLHYEVRINGVSVDPPNTTFSDVICEPSSAQADPAPSETAGTGGALDTPPISLEGDPDAVDFRVVSAYGRYDPEPGAIYGRVMDTGGEPLDNIIVELTWEGGAFQTTTGPDGQFLYQVYEPAVCVSVRIANYTSQAATGLSTGEGSYDIFFKQNQPLQ